MTGEAIRAGEAADAEPRGFWSRLERMAGSKVTATVLALLGTAGAGNWIAGRVQDRSRQQELALVSYKEFLAKEIEVVTAAYELTGGYLSASEDLIYLTGPAFDPVRFPEAAREKLEAQKQKLRDGCNTVDAEWRKKRESLGLLMAYYHPGRPGISGAWRQVQEAVDGFNACAVAWTVKHPQATAEELAGAPCGKEKAHVRERIDELNRRLDEARGYLWEQFGVVDRAARPGGDRR